MSGEGKKAGSNTVAMDVLVAVGAITALVLDVEGWFLLGAAGPGRCVWMWPLVATVNLALVVGLWRQMPGTAVGVVGASALGVVAPAIELPLVYLAATVLLLASIVGLVGALGMSLARHERRGREFVGRLLLLTVVLMVMGCYLLPRPGTVFRVDNGWALDLGLRLGVSCRVDLDELQSAAIELLERENRRPPTERPLRLYRSEVSSSSLVPEPIRRLGPNYLIVVPRRSGAEAVVIMTWGGGFLHWGVQVGRPSFRMATSRQVHRWRSGVYGFVGG